MIQAYELQTNFEFFFFSELSLLRERRDTVEVEKEEVETGPIGLEMHLSQSPPSP